MENRDWRQNRNKLIGISIFILFLLIISSFAYYTNITRYFDDSRKADGNSGYALERTSNEFIVEGCGAGTMQDTVTGLCWDKNMNHNGSTLQWSTVNTYVEPIWDNINKNYTYPIGRVKSDYPAFSYCEDLSLGGQTDWRLPSRNELHTLIDQVGTFGTTCTTLTGFGFLNCQDNYYWADREYKPSTTNALVVIFGSGVSGIGSKTNTYYAVCVR